VRRSLPNTFSADSSVSEDSSSGLISHKSTRGSRATKEKAVSSGSTVSARESGSFGSSGSQKHLPKKHEKKERKEEKADPMYAKRFFIYVFGNFSSSSFFKISLLSICVYLPLLTV
jgi:hypothetical protein